MKPLWNPPAYLIAVPQVVSAPAEYSDDETSDGEEGDGTFNAEEFRRPPFEINWTKRGEVTENDKLSSSCESYYESEFIGKIEKESFGKDVAQVQKRVAVVIGHNRMRSLSNFVNRFLVEKSKQCANSSILSREIHFFWRPQWKNITTGEEVEWEIVRKFYCQLKYRDRQNARLFRKESEGITLATQGALESFYKSYKETEIKSKEFFEKQPAISHFTRRHIQVFEEMLEKKTVSNVERYLKSRKVRIIPYREFREEIKDHLQTRKCIQILRKRIKGPIYMAFQDGDVKSVEELFSNYDIALQTHLKKHKRLPDVVSGGYKINEPHNPILEIGVRIDLWVRHFTAKVFPIGVYYPEPNTLVQVKEGDMLLEASFVDKRDYSSPKEMPTLIADLIKKRKIKHLKRSFLFDARAALTTATPERMQRCFKAFYTNQNKIVRWGLSDLTIYKGIAQTHYSNRSWAINLCDAIGVPKQIVYKDITIRKKELRELVISLVARLFSTYDPFEVARRTFLDAKGKKMGFQKTMISILSNYVPDELPLPPKKQINREHKGRLNKIWAKIDAIKRKEKLCATIDDFLEKPGTGHKIQTAAQSSMKKVVKIFRKNLSFNFIELSIAAMMSLEKPRDVKGHSRHTIIALKDIGSSLHQKVLEMVEIDSKEKLEFKKKAKELPEAERQGYLETYPMHWAAITGNVEAVRFLKSLNNSWISNTSLPGTKGLLPLHCAIRYCADNGNDIALVQELTTNRLDLTDWKASDALRESPLAMVLNELDDPYPVLEVLSEHPILAPANREALLKVLRDFKQAKYQKSMLKFLIDHVPAEEKSSLIKELHQQGVIFDEDMLSKAVKKILNQETFDGELCLTLIKCSRSKDDWHLFQLPCGHTFLEHVLDTDHHDAANFLVDYFRDFDALSPVETQKLRELTGNKTVMCKEDRESNERNAIRRAIKHCAREFGDQEGLKDPQARKVFFEYYIEDLIEDGSFDLHDFVNSEYESYDTSSYGDSLVKDSSDDSASDDSASNPKSSLSEDSSLSLRELSSDIEGCVDENESQDSEVEGYESHSSGEVSSRSFRSEDSSQSSPSRDYSSSSPSSDSSDSPVSEYSSLKRKWVF